MLKLVSGQSSPGYVTSDYGRLTQAEASREIQQEYRMATKNLRDFWYSKTIARLTTSQIKKIKKLPDDLAQPKFRGLTLAAKYCLRRYLAAEAEFRAADAQLDQLRDKSLATSTFRLLPGVSDESPGVRQIRRNIQASQRLKERLAAERQGDNNRSHQRSRTER